ncbi:MAG TPA: phosphatase PAP2 family protein [Rhodoblastus sp.]|nr:phosphatase PAP2 family protein [Rhodoblastus sp.]
MTTRALILLLIGAVYLFAIFALWPQIDLGLAALFHHSGHFIGRTPAGEYWRRFFYDAPYFLLGAFVLTAIAKHFGRVERGPSGRAILFLVLTLALGPGLLVNAWLKEVSHRPRPEQTQDFGGPWTFQPYESFSGQCGHNCSFVSGETATAAWTLAPALLAPPPARAYAVAAALLFTLATGLLRMAFGGHYFSDVVFAALFTFVVVLAGHEWYRRGGMLRG